jgi:site-specific recombinase XerD
LKRHHIEKYNLGLSAKKLAPQTRYSRLLWARSYLRWLGERGELHAYPDSLIRTFDFPKVPTTLPRPLAPHIDREIQKRFKESSRSLAIGTHKSSSRIDLCFLLMRKTGIRLGELAGLEFNCIRRDSKGRVFLKVPIGKLYNERLVPLDPKTVKIVSKIQNSTKAISKQQKRENPTKLINSRYGERIGKQALNYHFRRTVDDLINENGSPITTHQLRHTYATEMLNAGMSLQGLMKLLGHRCINMTLRYADVTQQSVMGEYLVAAKNNSTSYSPYPTLGKFSVNSASATQCLDNASRLLRNLGTDPKLRQKTRTLLQRLTRLQKEVSHLEEQ